MNQALSRLPGRCSYFSFCGASRSRSICALCSTIFCMPLASPPKSDPFRGMAFGRDRGIAINLRHSLSLELKTSRRWRSDAGWRRPPGWHDIAKSLNEKRTLIYQKTVFLPCSYANCGKNASDGERVRRITTGDIAFIFLRRTLGADNNPVETKRFHVRIKKPLIR